MGKIFRFHQSMFALALMFLLMVIFSSGESYGDVSEPADTTAEDLAGVALIASNAAVSIYLGTGLKSGKTSNVRGLLGIGVGAASITLGVTDNTSLSGVVAIAGAISLTLGILNFVGDGPTQQEDEQNFDLSRKISVIPFIVKAEEEQLGLGLLVSTSF